MVPLVRAAVRSAGFVVHDVPVPRGSESCQFAAIADQLRRARPACQPTWHDVRRDIAAGLESRYHELHHFLQDTDSQGADAWARRCQGYASGTHAGDELTLRGAAEVYGCRIHLVDRWGSSWYGSSGGECTEVLTLAYFDATDYRHYSSTRPLVTRPPGASDTAARAVDSRDVVGTDGRDAPPRPSAPPPPSVVDDAARAAGGSSVSHDWLDDPDDGGPGSLVQSLQHVDDPDGVPSILRGGLQRSEVDRVYQVLVGVCDRTRSVLEWVQASATGTTSRVSGRIVQFCGVAYRAPDGVSHPIYGGEHWGRGRRGRYLDTGDGPIPDQNNRTRNSNRLVRFLQRRLATAEAQLEVLGDVLAMWDTQCTFTIADTTRLHRVLTETALGMDGSSCSCQRFQIARCIADDEAGTMRDDDADGAVTDLTLVQSPCVGTWCRPVAASCVLVFQCVGGICRLDADSRDTLERDARSLTLSHRSTGGPGARNARGSSGGSSQRTRTDGQGGGGGTYRRAAHHRCPPS